MVMRLTPQRRAMLVICVLASSALSRAVRVSRAAMSRSRVSCSALFVCCSVVLIVFSFAG